MTGGRWLVLTCLLTSCQCNPGKNPNARAAISACLNAMRDRAGLTGKEHSRRMLLACGEMYTEKRCREAFQSCAEDPKGNWLVTITEECGAAYCPKLTDPKPAVCTKERDNSAEQWWRFHNAVMHIEIGDAAALAEAIEAYQRPGRELVQPFLSPPEDKFEYAPPRPRIEVRVDKGGSHWMVLVEEDGGTSAAQLPDNPKLNDFGRLTRAISGQCPRPLWLQADADSQFRWIKLIGEAAQDAGCDVTFHVLPRPDGG